MSFDWFEDTSDRTTMLHQLEVVTENEPILNIYCILINLT